MCSPRVRTSSRDCRLGVYFWIGAEGLSSEGRPLSLIPDVVLSDRASLRPADLNPTIFAMNKDQLQELSELREKLHELRGYL